MEWLITLILGFLIGALVFSDYSECRNPLVEPDPGAVTCLRETFFP